MTITNQELSMIKLETLWEDYAKEARLINVAELMQCLNEQMRANVAERANESTNSERRTTTMSRISQLA